MGKNIKKKKNKEKKNKEKKNKKKGNERKENQKEKQDDKGGPSINLNSISNSNSDEVFDNAENAGSDKDISTKTQSETKVQRPVTKPQVMNSYKAIVYCCPPTKKYISGIYPFWIYPGIYPRILDTSTYLFLTYFLSIYYENR